jgi:molybdopterin synthase catalytic subunit
MHVRMRLFALQRQQTGLREVVVELPPEASIETAWQALVVAQPVVAPARPAVRFARNGVYAAPEEPLADGDEVAVIPPVAGGAGEAPEEDRRGARVVRSIVLDPAPIDDAILAQLRAAVADDADGALVEFLGRTRETPGTPAPGEEAEAARHAGQRVLGLEYEAYEPMALAVLEAIADEMAVRFDVHRVAIRHRLGAVALGQTSVAIVVGAPHREAAFAACRYAIEELKARAPIWKAERFADGSVWMGAPARSGPAHGEG